MPNNYHACDTCNNFRAKIKVDACVIPVPQWYTGENVYIDREGNKLLVSSGELNYAQAEVWCRENRHQWEGRGLYSNTLKPKIRHNCNMWKEG